MKTFSSLVIGFFTTILVLPYTSASSLDGICKNVKDLGQCKTTIKVPSLELEWCNVDSFRFDKCKTQIGVRYSCGVSWKGVIWCEGWTCVPGTWKTTTRVPCGVKLTSNDFNVCKFARERFPAIDQITRTAAGYCSCMPKIFDMVELDTVKAAISSMDVSDAQAEVLQKFGDAQQCLIDNGFNVQDNKRFLTQDQGALVQTNTVKIFKAAELDLSRYIALATALSSCVISTCNEPAIRGWFVDYLTDSEELMAKQLIEFLTPWQNAFNSISSNFSQLGNDMKAVQEKFSTIELSVDKIAGDFCKNITACANTTVKKLEAKVKSTIKTSSAFIGLQNELSDAIKDVQTLYTTITTAIDAFEALSDLGIDNIFQLVLDGKINSVKDVTDTLQAAKKLPSIIQDLQQTIPNVQKYIRQLGDLGPEFFNNIEDILAETWLADARGDLAAAEEAELAVQHIQTLFEENVVSHVTSIADGITSIANSLQSILVSGIPTIEARVASYQRWSKGHFAMPCVTTETVILSLGGYSMRTSYPKFYRCEQSYNIPFPNHHIPYVKLTFGDSADLTPRSDDGIDVLDEPVVVEVPTNTTEEWIYNPESAGNQTAYFTGTTVDISASITVTQTYTYTTPTNVYTNINDVPTLTANPVIFFSTSGSNGALIASTTLLPGATFEPTVTLVSSSSTTKSLSTPTTAMGIELTNSTSLILESSTTDPIARAIMTQFTTENAATTTSGRLSLILILCAVSGIFLM